MSIEGFHELGGKIPGLRETVLAKRRKDKRSGIKQKRKRKVREEFEADFNRFGRSLSQGGGASLLGGRPELITSPSILG